MAGNLDTDDATLAARRRFLKKVLLVEMIYDKFGPVMPTLQPIVTMKGGARNHDDQETWTWLATAMALQPLAQINHTDFIGEEDPFSLDQIILVDPVDVEREAIKADYYRHLSKEARFVTNLLVEDGAGTRPTARSIANFLTRKKHWSTITIGRVFQELKEFQECFYERAY